MPFASAAANVSSASNIQYIQDVIEGAVYAQFGGEYDEIIFKVNTKNQYKKIIIVFSLYHHCKHIFVIFLELCSIFYYYNITVL